MTNHTEEPPQDQNELLHYIWQHGLSLGAHFAQEALFRFTSQDDTPAVARENTRQYRAAFQTEQEREAFDRGVEDGIEEEIRLDKKLAWQQHIDEIDDELLQML